MDRSERPLQSYYASRAAEYDQVYLKPERQGDLREIERWLPVLFAGRRVLEVACGTGHWTRFIAATANHVTGIDTSPETLHIAESRAPRDKARFLVGDAYEPSPDLGTFDAAFAGFWFSHVPLARRRAFLQGLRARLAPGALVVLLDNRFVSGSSSPVSETDCEGDTYQVRTLADGSTHRVLKNFPTEVELRSALAGVGTDVKFVAWQYYWALQYSAARA